MQLKHCKEYTIKKNLILILCFPILSNDLNSGKSLFPNLLNEIEENEMKSHSNLLKIEEKDHLFS
jgi:hypothetical protein